MKFFVLLILMIIAMQYTVVTYFLYVETFLNVCPHHESFVKFQN